MAWLDPEIRVKEGSLILEVWARWEGASNKQRIASLTVPYVLRESGGSTFESVDLTFWKIRSADREGDSPECFDRVAGPVKIEMLLKEFAR